MSETREFDLSDVLSISTGRLVSARGIDAIYDVMGFLLRDPGITTIGLMMCAKRCAAGVLAQHPALADVDAESVNLKDADVRARWLAEQRAKYGDSLSLHPITDTPSAPTLDEQVAEVLSRNPDMQFVTVARPTP